MQLECDQLTTNVIHNIVILIHFCHSYISPSSCYICPYCCYICPYCCYNIPCPDSTSVEAVCYLSLVLG